MKPIITLILLAVLMSCGVKGDPLPVSRALDTATR